MKTSQELEKELFSRISGRIGETIIERLLIDMGYRVYKNGIENTHSMGTIAPTGPVSKELRNRPDFVVVDDSNIAYYVEVKYRTNGAKDLKRTEIENYPDETIIVLVQPNALRACKKKELNEKLTNFKLLATVPPFDKNPTMVGKYMDFMRTFFK